MEKGTINSRPIKVLVFNHMMASETSLQYYREMQITTYEQVMQSYKEKEKQIVIG